MECETLRGCGCGVGVGKTPGVGVGVAAGGGWTAKEVRVAAGLAGLASKGSDTDWPAVTEALLVTLYR